VIKIKGTGRGLRILVHEDLAAREPGDIESALRQRLQTMGDFLDGAQVRVELAAPRLLPGVVDAVLRALESVPGVSLLGIGVGTEGMADAVMDTEFHFGNIRSGQTVSSPATLVIFGNVNPGGRAAAVGDLYITGALSGFAVAGAEGDSSRRIYAGRMNPLQIRIGDAMARGGEASESSGAECAVVEDGGIAIYPAEEAIGRRSDRLSFGTADH